MVTEKASLMADRAVVVTAVLAGEALPDTIMVAVVEVAIPEVVVAVTTIHL